MIIISRSIFPRLLNIGILFSNDESIGFADKVEVDLTTKLSQISMYSSDEKIYIIYNNE